MLSQLSYIPSFTELNLPTLLVPLCGISLYYARFARIVVLNKSSALPDIY